MWVINIEANSVLISVNAPENKLSNAMLSECLSNVIQGFSFLSKSGSRGHLIWENSLLIFKIGKTRMETLKSLFHLKIIQKHEKLHFRTIKNIKFGF